MNTGGFMAMPSPTDALIGSRFVGATSVIQIGQIENNLPRLQVLGEIFFLRRFVSDDYYLGASHHLLEISRKQRSDVRNHLLDVLTIGTREAPEGHILIPDLHLTALSEKPLHQMHLWTLS